MAAVDPSNPQSWNRYSYSLNNPLNNIDPLGLFCVWDDGTYDSPNDPVTGMSSTCGNAGGTWFNGSPSNWDPNAGDWSGQASAEFAGWAQGINPSVGDFGTPSGTPDASVAGLFPLISILGNVTSPVTPCTSRNGRPYGAQHRARDYHLPSYGTPIPAPENGTVTGGRSNSTHVIGPYDLSQLARPGSTNFTQFTAQSGNILSYSHTHPAVPIGTFVAQGNAIGISDNSGRITGPHTHVQIIDPSGARIDPNSYFTECQ